jgi:mono/diheme cytochrome c family protein
VSRFAVLSALTCAAAAWPATRASAQISPGPLARAHQELEGPRNCLSCHAGGRSALSANCLACHKDVGWLIERKRGLHATVTETSCASCHPDHAGASFDLIKWPDGDAQRFDHARAGWALRDKHATTKCDACHATRYRLSPAAALAARKTGAGWTGLEQACASCHADPHRGVLGRQCEKCHGAARWNATPGFDHARTRYALTGKHVTTKCADCHLDPRLGLAADAAGRPIPRYRPLAFGECSDCHKDPHTGALGPRCASCHETQSFKVINTARFDHERTRYPLKGRHAAVKCEKCHDFSTGVSKLLRNPRFAVCADCHRDAHGGTATLAGRNVDCTSCHAVDGWKPATYTVAQHRLAAYPLAGQHERVPCAACHVKNPAGVPTITLGTAAVWMRPVATRCQACHADDHNGQLASRPGGAPCERCHKVAGWTPSTYTAAAHKALRLDLTGRHAEITCAACHGPLRRGLPPLPAGPALGKAGVALTLKEVACASCHVDPHRGKAPRCLECHDTRTFRPSTVDVAAHKRYRLPLDGAHAAVPCVTCHAQMKHAPATSSLVLARWAFADVLFTAPRGGCEGCHETPHGRQFATRADRGACEKCHGADMFRPANRFDHDRDATFTLKGAHARVACARCHRASRGAGGKLIVAYRPVSGKCESCHGEELRRGP